MDLPLAEYELIAPFAPELLYHHDDFYVKLAQACKRSRAMLADNPELVHAGMDPPSHYKPARPFRDDALLEIEPAVYVEKLTRVIVPRSGMIRCPFPEHEDRNRSMKVYVEAERGVWCFGCQRGGSIYDFAAALWGYKTKGDDFRHLRKKIAEALTR